MKKKSPIKTILIAGGGTGGHIYPALAIADAIKKLQPDIQIKFVGTAQGLETKIVPKANYQLYTIAGGKLNISGHFLLKLKTIFKMPLGILQSVKLLLKYKPMCVLGVGGYASGPFVLTAALLRFPTAIWEPNAHPGLTNRLLARVVDKCFVVFQEAQELLSHKKTIQLGMPVRSEIAQQCKVASEENTFNILVFGGSQGSRIINTSFCEAVQLGGDWLAGTQIVHQIGSTDFLSFQQKYKGHESQVNVLEYIFDMPKYYQKTDLVVCRSGASTLVELAAFGLPAIFIPLPAADGHQEKNALVVEKAGGARVILQKDLNPVRLAQEITAIKANGALRQQMSQKIAAFYLPGAAEKIAQELIRK